MKKYTFKNELDRVTTAFCASQTDILRLIGVSRQYAHAVNSRKVFPSHNYVDKIGDFKLMILKQAAKPKRARENIKATECERKASVTTKKLNDVRDALQRLTQLEEAILLTEQLKETHKPKSLAYNWCVLHLRILRKKLPKNLELVRAEYEAQEAGQLAVIKYWQKRSS